MSFGIIVGFVSHLIADSLTVTGVYWLWPLGKDEKKYYHNGSISTGTTIEKYIQMALFTISGFLFFAKQVTFTDIFSIQGVIMVAVVIYVGYIFYDKLAKSIKRTIRKSKI